MSNKKNNIERRTYNIEFRQDEDNSRSVTGYAALYDKRSQDLGGFIEIIAPGAFDEAINTSDVRALFNHDPNKILARSNQGEGSLMLTVDENGLRYHFNAPDTTAGNDLLVSLKRGDISQSSFGFTVNKDDQEWREENGENIRTIKKISRLFDVSPVTYPAYLDTSVAQRSTDTTAAMEGLKEFKESQDIEIKGGVGPEIVNLPPTTTGSTEWLTIKIPEDRTNKEEKTKTEDSKKPNIFKELIDFWKAKK